MVITIRMIQWVMCVEVPKLAMQEYGKPERLYRIVRDESSKLK
jgi:hypothetical protein